MEGDCVVADGPKAIEWFQKAADQGMTGSLATMARMYKEGLGVEQDQDEARRLYREAGFDEF
jgi:TPR repeat protein